MYLMHVYSLIPLGLLSVLKAEREEDEEGGALLTEWMMKGSRQVMYL